MVTRASFYSPAFGIFKCMHGGKMYKFMSGFNSETLDESKINDHTLTIDGGDPIPVDGLEDAINKINESLNV